MSNIQLILKERREVATGTTAFIFEKPEGFEFKAGQNGDFSLINPPETDAEGNTRAFSIAAAPSENFVMLATRMRDTAFKRVLAEMPIGSPVMFSGPMGSMTLQSNTTRPAVFLAGGIGITPFRSMIVEAAAQQLPHKIFLFYSNRRPADAAFLRELSDLQNENRNYKLIATMTQAPEDSWDGEEGYIDARMLEKYLGDVHAPIYYLAGPPAMISALHKTLNDMGIVDDDIRTEEFAGY